MASYTDSLGLNLQDTGTNDNTWGQVLNKQLELIEAAIAGTTRIVLAANDYELTSNDGSEDEGRSAVLDIQGQPAENLNVIVPSVSKLYVVRNNTTGGFDVSVRTKLGSGVTVPQGEARALYCDGDDVLFEAKAEDSRKAGGMIPGDVIPRNVNDKNDDGAFLGESLLDVENMDQRYVPAGAIASIGNFTTGDVKYTLKEAENGWVRMQDGTIGPENSGATAMASNDAKALYKMLWSGTSDDNSPVSGGRGATSDDDWAAGKPIALPKSLGRAIATAGKGKDISDHALAAVDGEEMHTMTEDELVPHKHKYQKYGSANGASGAENDDSGGIVDSESTGGGEPFNVVGPRFYMNLLIKL